VGRQPDTRNDANDKGKLNQSLGLNLLTNGQTGFLHDGLSNLSVDRLNGQISIERTGAPKKVGKNGYGEKTIE